MLRSFNSLSPGMEKDDVLDIMGSPKTTLRREGKDRWLYVFYDDKIRFEKEVQFYEGKAVYVGEIWQPSVDQAAASVDAKNAIGTEEGRRQTQKEYQEYIEEAKPAPEVKYVPKFDTIQ